MTSTPFRLGILPGESPAVVARLSEPLRAYLERRLLRPVEVVIGPSYAATGESLRQGQVDIAYLGPVSYILQRRHANLEPFARPTHASSGPTFQAVIIVPADSPTVTLGDLKGRDVAFGDLASTSGTWVPRHMLLEAGLVADRDYTRRTLGAHDAVARGVAARRAAAGALSKPVLERLLVEKTIDPSSVRVLAESLPIPEYMWVFRAELEHGVRARARSAFLELRDAEALREFRAEAFIPAVDPDVDRVRIWMEAILQTRLTPTALPWTPNEAHYGWRRADDASSARPLPQ